MPKPTPRKRKTYKSLDASQIQQVINQRLQQFEAEQLGHELNLVALDDQMARIPADAPEEAREQLQNAIVASEDAMNTLDAAITAMESEKTSRS